MENEMDHEMIVKRLAELMPPTDELSRSPQSLRHLVIRRVPGLSTRWPYLS